MRPARVLHVAKVKGIGGCERHLLTLLPSLSATGMAVRLLVLEAGEDERRFVAQAWDAGIDMERAPAGADGDPRAISAVTAAIRRFSPDVVHTHRSTPTCGASSRRAVQVFPGSGACTT